MAKKALAKKPTPPAVEQKEIICPVCGEITQKLILPMADNKAQMYYGILWPEYLYTNEELRQEAEHQPEECLKYLSSIVRQVPELLRRVDELENRLNRI